jgi:hypothetical protein
MPQISMARITTSITCCEQVSFRLFTAIANGETGLGLGRGDEAR